MQSNTYKIVIIGESCVGKTSILLRYIKGEFIKVDKRTDNPNCTTKMITINESSFILQIWDTAGQEKYHALTPMFYKNAEGAVLVFDLSKRDSFNLVEKWFLELREYAEDIKIVLVGNKCDLPKDKIEVNQLEAKELAKKFGVKFISASALDDINISDIFSTVTFEIYHSQLKKEKEKVIKKRKSIRLINEENKIKDKGCC